MKIQIWTIGKSNEPYVDEGIRQFTRKIQHYYPCEWTIIPNLKNASQLSEQELKVKEGELITGMLASDDYLILLDERGKQISSEELADFIQQRANESKKKIIFLIGGAFGVSDAVMKRAQFKWSFSKLVFPHQLVRLMLAEQLYRACTILRNEKYHHS